MSTQKERLNWLLARGVDHIEAVRCARAASAFPESVFLRAVIHVKTGENVPLSFDEKFNALDKRSQKRFSRLLDEGYNWSEALFWVTQRYFTYKKMIEGKPVDLHLFMLCGAAQRRSKWLIRNGFTNGEAYRLAPYCTSKQNDDQNIQMPFPVRMAPVDYPATQFTRLQTVTISKAIMDRVSCQGNPNLHFMTMFFVDGYFLVPCFDQPAVQWLCSIIRQLQPWEGAAFKMISRKDAIDFASGNVTYASNNLTNIKSIKIQSIFSNGFIGKNRRSGKNGRANTDGKNRVKKDTINTSGAGSRNSRTENFGNGGNWSDPYGLCNNNNVAGTRNKTLPLNSDYGQANQVGRYQSNIVDNFSSNTGGDNYGKSYLARNLSDF